MTLRIANHRLAVSSLLRVTAHHLRYDFDGTAVAVAEPHPDDPGVIGLRNETRETWSYTTVNGRRCEVAPARRLRLLPGMSIRIGSHTAVVEPAEQG